VETKPLLQYNRSFEDLYRLGERGSPFPENFSKREKNQKPKAK